MSNADDMESRVAELEAKLKELSTTAALATDINVVWIIISAVLVFFMQVGFAMVSAWLLPTQTTAVFGVGLTAVLWQDTLEVGIL